MSDVKDDGGPAFPLKNYTSEIGPDLCGFMAKDCVGNELWVNSGSPGMSLRDWLAGQCNVVPYMTLETLCDKIGKQPTVSELAAYITQVRFIEADAMLAERSKEADDG